MRTAIARKAETLRRNLQAMIDCYGLNCIGFLTLTFKENITSRTVAEKRFHAFATNILPLMVEAYIAVPERQERGRFIITSPWLSNGIFAPALIWRRVRKPIWSGNRATWAAGIGCRVIRNGSRPWNAVISLRPIRRSSGSGASSGRPTKGLRHCSASKLAGNPLPNYVKFFATAELVELAQDRNWLAKATNALSQFWHKKNATRTTRRPDLRPGQRSLALALPAHAANAGGNGERCS